MLVQSQARQLTELLSLPEATVEDMTIIDGVGLFFVIRSTRRDAECPRCGKRSRHLHTNNEPTDLVDVVTAAIALVENDYPDAPSRIVLDTPALSPVVKVDRNKLCTALVELLDNARRYGDPQPPTRVVVLEQPDWALVQVLDQGPGISAQAQAAIFDPFYRVDEDRSRRTGGTGLGLTLVRSLVEAMGGQVSLRSQPQQGCVFTIALPT